MAAPDAARVLMGGVAPEAVAVGTDGGEVGDLLAAERQQVLAALRAAREGVVGELARGCGPRGGVLVITGTPRKRIAAG